MRIDIISIFPPMFEAVSGFGIPSRAIKAGLLEFTLWNPRDYTDNKHRYLDDRPYGGGPGMVMEVEPLARAIAAAKAASTADASVLYLSPQGRVLDHAGVMELSKRPRLILLAGRYEGVDERLIEAEVDEEWSVGDYVLSGGELAAMVMIDAIARQLPGALGDEDSAEEDSFVNGLLDCPHYTRPEMYQGRAVPEVLMSGDHERIRRWRLKQALGRTWQRRPELLARMQLTKEQQELLAEFQREWQAQT
jgi:tRNA (guanine37-N1)-methyltransferase